MGTGDPIETYGCTYSANLLRNRTGSPRTTCCVDATSSVGGCLGVRSGFMDFRPSTLGRRPSTQSPANGMEVAGLMFDTGRAGIEYLGSGSTTHRFHRVLG